VLPAPAASSFLSAWGLFVPGCLGCYGDWPTPGEPGFSTGRCQQFLSSFPGAQWLFGLVYGRLGRPDWGISMLASRSLVRRGGLRGQAVGDLS